LTPGERRIATAFLSQISLSQISGIRRFRGGFSFGSAVGGDFGGDVFQGEFAGQVAGGVGGGVKESVVDGENNASVIVRAIEVGDASGGEVAEDVGEVELAFAVVSAADEC